MKILLIFYGDFPDGNASIARIKSLAKGCKRNEIDPFLLNVLPTYFDKNSSTNDTLDGKWEDIPFKNLILAKDYYKSKMHKVFYFFFVKLLSAIWLVKHRKDFDIVYFHLPSIYNSFHLFMLCKLLGIKTIVDQTEVQSFSGNKLRRKIHLIEEKLVAKYSNHIIAISNLGYKYFNSLSVQSISRLATVVDLERFSPFLRTDKTHTIGYIGSYYDKDGIDTIIKGFEIAIESNPKLTLKLIGAPSNPEKTNSLITNSRAFSNIHVVGKVTYEDIPAHLNECDALIMNRTKSNFAQAGYPIKLGEYFATGRTVLMSDSGGFSNDFTHLNEAIIYNAESSQAFAEAICWRYENYEQASKIGLNGLYYAQKHFDHIAVVDEFTNVIKTIK